MKFDIIISGQGLAGSVLAYTLIKRNFSVLVINNEHYKSATSVAAGLFNPVTGKKMSLTWKAKILFPFLLNFYRQAETDTGRHFLIERPVFRPFPTEHEKNIWIEGSGNEAQEFVDVLPPGKFSDLISDEFGGIQTKYSGNLLSRDFLSAIQSWLEARSAYLNGSIDPAEINPDADFIRWGDITAKKIIFCEGYHGKNNPWFRWLPFAPVKGEIADIEAKGLNPDVILNKHMFIVPSSSSSARIGATYCWDFDDEEPREEGKRELEDKLGKFLKKSFTITDIKAGVRPSSADRKPFVGLHPVYQTIGIFNGLGTKGISLAPYFAAQYADFLEGKGKIDEEVNISRFFPFQ